MSYPFALPDGPIHSFQALPARLPDCVQEKLKTLSAKCAGLTGEELLHAQTRLNEYIDKVRDVLGVEFVRREYVPITAYKYKCAACGRYWTAGTSGRKKAVGGGWRCPDCVK